MKFISLISYATAAVCFAPGAWAGFPDLTPLGLQLPSVITSEPNPTVTFAWGATNQGLGTAGLHYDGIYLSTDAAMHNIIGQLSNWYVPGPVAPGAVSWGTNNVVLPIGWSGDYYLAFITDLYNWVQESDESNNIIVAPFKFKATPADLAPLTLQADPSVTGPPNPPLTVVWAVTNLGPGTARGPWLDTLYLTPSLTGRPELAYLGQFYPPGPLAPGEVYWQTNTVRAGVYSSGSYYLLLRTDDTNCLYEANYENNTMVTPIKLTIQPPDLAPLAFLAPTNIAGPANLPLPLTWCVTNQGAGTALAPWPEVVYLSTNSVLNEQTDLVIDFTYQTNSVPAGGAYWVTNTGIGAFNRSGTYYLTFKTDPYNILSESDTNNNATTAVPIRFTLQEPDLLPLISQVPTVVTSAPNPWLTLSWGVINQGTTMAGGWWADEIYLSSDRVLDSSDQRIYSGYNLNSLGVNESYWHTNLLYLPLTQSGTYYLIFKAGAYGTLNESDTSNNVNAVPIQFTILAPNLVPVGLQAPASVSGLPKPSIQLIRGVTNRGPGPAEGSWYDEVYFSAHPQWDSSATFVVNSSMYGPVAPGATYWATNTVQLPGALSGTYYLLLKANSGKSLFESDYGDNVTSTPIQLNISAPDLVPLTSLVPTVITSAPNPAITLVWGITNQGAGAAIGSGWMDAWFLSTNSVRDGTESRLDIFYEYTPIEPGQALWLTNNVRFPLTASGSYYLFLEINWGQWLFESDFTNNVVALPVRFEIQRPDLAPVAFLAPSQIAAEPYPTVTLVWGVTNQGKGEAECAWGWSDQIFVSTNDTVDVNASSICSLSEQKPVASGQTYWQTNAVRLPVSASGTYHLFLKVDRWQNLLESDVSNNVAVLSLRYDAQMPDLAAIDVNTPVTVTGPPNPKIAYSWGITNQGAGAAIPYNSAYADAVQLSSDPAWHPYSSSLSYQYRWDPVGVGQSYRLTNTVQVPVTQSGTFYLVFKTDAGENLIESDYSNNVATVPITFNIVPPDLSPLALLAPTNVTAAPNPAITLIWGVTNQGTGPAVGGDNWYDQVYLSQSPRWDSAGTCLISTTEQGPVAAGGTYWRTNSVRLPVVQSGNYFLLFKTDFNNVLCESNPSNNLAIVPISFEIHPPDLAPLTSLVPTSVTGAPDPKFTLVWGVTNQGTGAAISRSSWANRVYFSETPALDRWRAPQLAYWSEPGLEAGSAAWQTNTIQVPVVESGTNYLVFLVNSDLYDWEQVYEEDYGNNIVSVPVSFEILKPDLVPFALRAPQGVTGPPNPTVTFVWGITNQGAGPALPDSVNSWGNWVDSLYVSTNASLNHGESLFSSLSQMNSIPAGGCYWLTNSVRVPVVESGTYYVLLQANANRFLHESDYSNNLLAIPLSFDIQPPDLAPVALHLPTVLTSVPNPTLTLIWGVTNQGSGLAEGYWYDTLYISTNFTYDGKARSLVSDYEATPVPAGGGYWRTNSVLFPVTQSGTYYLTFQVNSGNSLIESDGSNNFLAKPVTFTIQPPDLRPIALQTPASVSGPPNPSFEIAWGVTNQGIGAVTQNQSWVDRIYFSAEPKRTRWGDPVIAVQYEPGPLAPGQSYWRSQVVRAPVAQNGTYYLVFSGDDDNSFFESDETNNIVAMPVTFQINPPDLAPLGLQVPGVVDSWPNPTIQLVWGVTNQGSGPAIPGGSWSDGVFLSRDPVFSYSDLMVASRSEIGPVPAGGSYWRTLAAQVPVYTSGDYYLIFKTDTGNLLGEASETNNTLAVPVHFNISVPDLAPIAFIVPSNVMGAPNSALTLVCGVTNQGAGMIPTSASPWVDRIFLSTHAVLDRNSAEILSTSLQQGPLDPGAVYWRTNQVPMPVSRDGAYYLFYEANSQSANLAESDYSNNVAVAQVSFQLTPPDIVPFAFLCPTQVTCAFPSVTVVWGVTNRGSGPAIGSPFPWTDSVSLFSPTQPEGYSRLLGSWSWPQTNIILPGQTCWTTNTVALPINKNGDYTLSLTTDTHHDLGQSVGAGSSTNVLLSANLVAPNVAPFYLSVEGPFSGLPNPRVSVAWGVTNRGTVPAWAGSYGYWVDRLFLSSNAVLDNSAVPILSWQQKDPVPVGGSYWVSSTNVSLPARAAGDYFLILQVDTYNALQRVDASNNVAVTPIKIPALPLADLAPTLFLAPTILTTAPNPSLTLVWGVTNQGAGAAEAEGGWSDGIYLSTAAVPDGTERFIGAYPGTNRLAPGAVYWRTNLVRLPVAASGTYYLIFKSPCYASVPESDYGNNTAAAPIMFNITVPNLVPIALQAPSYVADIPYPQVTIVAGVTNQGAGPAFAANDMVYLSATPGRDASARVVAAWPRSVTVPPGGTYWLTNTVELPVADSGRYYLVFEPDADNTLGQSDLLNKSAVVPIDLELSLVPDLAVTDFQVPPFVVGPANPKVQLVWHVINQGLGPASRPWADAVSVFTNNGSGYVVLGRFAETNPVPAGGEYWRTNTVTLPVTQSTTLFLRLRADQDDDLYEFAEGNNEAYATITFTLTTPAPAVILGPGRVRADGSFELAVTGSKGAVYMLQSSTNLLDWARVCDFTCTQETTWAVDPSATGSTERFYRVVQRPILSPGQ